MDAPAEPGSLVTVVIVTYQGERFIDRCLDALASQEVTDGTGRVHRPEIWVIDNASSDRTVALAAAHPLQPRLVPLPTNLGFAGAADHAVREVSSPFVVLLNQDAVVGPGWLSALLAPFFRPDADRLAATTSKVVFADSGLLNNTGVLIAPDGYGSDRGFREPDDGRYGTEEEVAAFSGTAAALRVEAVRQVGSFDPDFFLYYEDTDLSQRLRKAGWRIRYVPDALVRHVHAASSDVTSELFAFYNERNRLWMLAKCAPAVRVIWEILRFAGITALIPLRRLLGRPIPPGHQFRMRLRLRVLAAVWAALPSLLRKRRAVRLLSKRPPTGHGPSAIFAGSVQ
ncbi:MAG: glycosyltransferase family 2 protein [Acidothermus sp.]|nr:glycosyltransferase family 2 protein [Acidothermus sp.]